MTVRRRQPIRAGDHVRVTSGEHRGRVGVVQTHGLDGVAVRLVSLDPLWPFTVSAVIQATDLARIRRVRTGPVEGAEPALM